MKKVKEVPAPKHLWECETFQEQKAWCRAKLLSGRTLSDTGIFLGGANPDRIIRSLRRSGLELETCYVEQVDAAGVRHPRILAWRLLQSADEEKAT